MGYPADLISVHRDEAITDETVFNQYTTQRAIMYSVLILPDIAAESTRAQPSTVVDMIANDSNTREYLARILNVFDTYTNVNTNVGIVVSPRFSADPILLRVRFYDVQIQVDLWKGFAVATAVIIDMYEMIDSENVVPTRWQVLQGFNGRNQ